MIKDIMSYTDLKHIPGYIVLLDFEKAFDSVDWSFLFMTLHAFNFGPNFTSWIIFYIQVYPLVSAIMNTSQMTLS